MMILTSINLFKPIWLIVAFLISISLVYGQQSTTEVTTISVDNYENSGQSNSSEISIPKVQSRFFNWLMNGLNGQGTSQPSGLSNGFSGLGSMFRPNLSPSSPFRQFESALGFGSNNGFGMQSMGQSSMSPLPPPPPMGQPPMGQPPMGQPPMGRPPMGRPPMERPPMGRPPMERPPMERPLMGRPPLGSLGQIPMGPSSGFSQSQFGSSMGSQGVTPSNYGGNGQPIGPLDGPLDYVSTNDPFSDYGGMSDDNTI